MIQDIFPILSNTYVRKTPQPDSYLLGFDQHSIFFKCEQDQIVYLTYGQLKTYCTENCLTEPEMVYLFSIGSTDYFLTDLTSAKLPGFSFHELFQVRSLRPKAQVLAAATAWHLYVWYRDNQFCGRCGKKLSHSIQERKLECSCGNEVFPKIAPAVIVGVTNGDQLLLTKYAGGAYKRYALIAGFTEIGETLEETVRREVYEETGIHVKHIRYYKSQPWGFASNLLVGYFCDLDGSPEIHMDSQELSVAEWVNYSSIPKNREGLSLTGEMMEYFRDQRAAQKPI